MWRTGIYLFIVLGLIGSVIPITSPELLLGVGVGLKNTINLQGTLLQSVDGLLQVQFPVIIGVLICAVAVFSLMITRTKIGQDFTQLSSNQQNPIDSDWHTSKVRITAIAISTIVAAWGQIILLQNTGIFSTYGSHMGIGVLAVSALVVGGATILYTLIRSRHDNQIG